MGQEQGAALIEAALVIPMLLLIAVGIFEFGRAYQTWEVLTNAAREGARVAVLPYSTDSDAEARVRQFLQVGGLVNDDTVSVNGSDPNTLPLTTSCATGWNTMNENG